MNTSTITTKEKILDAALDQFSINGYNGVSVKQIADKVGIKDSSLYKHFTSKKEIYDTLMNEMNERFERNVRAYRLPQGDIAKVAKEYGNKDLKMLKNACKGVFLFLLKDPKASKFRKMLVIEQYKNKDASNAYKSWFFDSAISYQTELFKEMIKQGYFKKGSAETIAMQFYSPFYVLLNIYDACPQKEDEAIRRLFEHIEQFAKMYQTESK